MATKKSGELFVTAAMVAVKRADGSLAYLYKGARVPDGLDPGDEKRLTALGMIGPGPAGPVTAVAPRVSRRGVAAKNVPPVSKKSQDLADNDPPPDDLTPSTDGD